MPLLYEPINLQRSSFQEVRKVIWTDKRLKVSAIKWSDHAVERFEQTWDPEKTTLKRATFNFTIHGSVPYSIPVPSIEAWLRVNGVEVGHGGWAPWTSCTSHSGTVDVTAFLRNGWNTLEAELRGYFLTLECAVTISAEFVFEYEGQRPAEAKTEEEKRREELMRYITYGFVGIGGVVALYFVGKAVIERRRK